MRLILVIVGLVFASPKILNAQNVDSLKLELSSANDSLELVLLKKISRFYLRSNIDSAFSYSIRFKNAALEKQNSISYAEAIGLIGNTHLAKGEYTDAANYFHQSLSIYEKYNLKGKIAAISTNLGVVHSHTKNYQIALEHYKRALAIDTELNDEYYIIADLSNMAGVFTELNLLDSSKHCYKVSLQIALRNKYNDQEAIIYNNLGNVYQTENKIDSALYYYTKSTKLKEAAQNEFGLMFDYTNMGAVFSKLNQPIRSEEYFKKALYLTSRFENRELQQEILEGLINLSLKQENFEKAYQYQHDLHLLSDSLLNESKSKQLLELQVKYETEKKQNEIDILEAEAEYQLLVKNIIIIASLFVFTLLFLIYSRIRLRNKLLENREELHQEKQRRLQEELDAKNRELTSYAVRVMERNELMSVINNKLNDLVKEETISPTKLKSVIRSIRSNLEFSDDWQNLKLHFEQVHPDFFKKIESAHPSLSQNDLKHCAYIRMNLNRKEVARLINVDTNSVKVTRYRIKKKMDLDAATDLDTYISNLT